MGAAGVESDDVTGLLRDSMRGLLQTHWRPDGPTGSGSPEAIVGIWERLVQQGVTVLGSDREERSLSAILVVMEELGRAICPAPMWSAVLANIALPDASSAANEMRRALEIGTARVAFSFGAFDPDPGIGSIALDEGKATGSLRFIEAAGSATHLLVAVGEAELALVDLGAAAVK